MDSKKNPMTAQSLMESCINNIYFHCIDKNKAKKKNMFDGQNHTSIDT